MSYSVQLVDEDFYGRNVKKPRGKILKQHVDTTKVHLPIIKEWLEEEMQKHLPDDDIAVELIYEMLEGNKEPGAGEIQEQLQTFLGDDDGRVFCQQLWQLLVSAQEDKDGIPEQLLEKRKQQMEQQTRHQAKAMIEQMRSHGGREKQRPDRNNKREHRQPRNEKRFGRPEKRSEGPQWVEQSSSARKGLAALRDRKDESPNRREPTKKTNYNRSTRGTFERDDAGYRRNPSLM